MPPKRFRCYLVSKDPSGKTQGQVAERDLSELPAGEVLIRVAYSSLNFKDALSATGHPGVTRKFPHVPGIDVAGVVVSSRDSVVKEGDEVLVTGFDMGQNTWGGFAEFIQVPTAWVMPLPKGLSLRESMIYGTAGLTAGQCLEALQRNEITPASGKILVTGSTGGVGSLAVAILAQAGYEVEAATGKAAEQDRLVEIGAREVIARDAVNDTSTKTLLPPRWAGAIDTVGGSTLTTIVRSLEHSGCVAACGLVGGTDLPLTVYPFILRGVTLAGVDSALCPMATRSRIWHQLAGPWRPPRLEKLATEEITIDSLDGAIQRILAGQVVGRVLVKPA
jgi:acrylyl-CoA reductase (NADPH)